MSYNKIIIIGNAGGDPELRYTPSGKAVANFSIACNHYYKDSSGEKKEDTTWFRVVAWGKLAETIGEYITKGKQVYVEGRLSMSTWTNRDGEERTTLECTASTIQFLGGKVEKEAEAEDDDFLKG